MAVRYSKWKMAAFTLVAVILVFLPAEFICRSEENLSATINPSMLSYQQVPFTLFKPQKLFNRTEVLRTVAMSPSYQAIPRKKPEGQIRVGVVGASAVAGMGYCPTWSFPGMLQRLCDLAEKDVLVVNLGRVGYSSRQLIPVAQRAVNALKLDHLVVYTGNNEFLEANALLTAGRTLDGYTAQTKGWLSKSACYRTLHRAIFAGKRIFDDGESSMIQKNNPLPEGVHDVVKKQFQENLSQITQVVGDKTQLTFCTVPTNLMFWPGGKEPFFLSGENEKMWRALEQGIAQKRLGQTQKSAEMFAKAISLAGQQPGEALSLLFGANDDLAGLAEAVIAKISGRSPADVSDLEMYTLALACQRTENWSPFLPFEGHLLKHKAGSSEGLFWKGRLTLLKGDSENGKKLLAAAKDSDDTRIRVPSDFNNAIREVAKIHGVSILDLEGRYWNFDHFNDYCHFNLDGNLSMARALYTHLFLQTPPDSPDPKQWLQSRDVDFLESWWWLGVDDQLWKVYAQRPTTLPDTPTLGDVAGRETVPEKIWAANRILFTWAGGNLESFALMEQGYRASFGTAYEIPGKKDLDYLYFLEGKDGPGMSAFKEKGRIAFPAR